MDFNTKKLYAFLEGEDSLSSININDQILETVSSDQWIKDKSKIIEIFKKADLSNKDKLNKYFINAIGTKNWELIVYLAKQSPTHKCFLQQFIEFAECSNYTCIENIIVQILKVNIEYYENFDCIKLCFKLLGSTEVLKDIDSKSLNNLVENILKNDEIELLNKIIYYVDVNEYLPNLYISSLSNYAVIYNRYDILDIIFKNNKKISDKNSCEMLFNTIRTNNVEMMKYLLEYNFNVNCKNIRDKTPLMFSVENVVHPCENEEIIELLINNGADVNVCSYADYLFSAALKECNNRIIKLLLQQDIDLNKEEILDNIAKRDDKEILKIILDSNKLTQENLMDLLSYLIINYVNNKAKDLSLIETWYKLNLYDENNYEHEERVSDALNINSNNTERINKVKKLFKLY
jgi:hypothetical protein